MLRCSATAARDVGAQAWCHQPQLLQPQPLPHVELPSSHRPQHVDIVTSCRDCAQQLVMLTSVNGNLHLRPALDILDRCSSILGNCSNQQICQTFETMGAELDAKTSTFSFLVDLKAEETGANTSQSAVGFGLDVAGWATCDRIKLPCSIQNLWNWQFVQSALFA